MPQAPRDYTELQVPPSAYTLPYHIALIINSVVEEIIHLEEGMANLFLSNPTFSLIDPEFNDGRFSIQISANDQITNMHLDERSASILLSNPTIKQVDLPLSNTNGPDVGWIYNLESNSFSEPI